MFENAKILRLPTNLTLGRVWALGEGRASLVYNFPVADHGKENGNDHLVRWDKIGIMERNMQTTI